MTASSAPRAQNTGGRRRASTASPSTLARRDEPREVGHERRPAPGPGAAPAWRSPRPGRTRRGPTVATPSSRPSSQARTARAAALAPSSRSRSVAAVCSCPAAPARSPSSENHSCPNRFVPGAAQRRRRRIAPAGTARGRTGRARWSRSRAAARAGADRPARPAGRTRGRRRDRWRAWSCGLLGADGGPRARPGQGNRRPGHAHSGRGRPPRRTPAPRPSGTSRRGAIPCSGRTPERTE